MEGKQMKLIKSIAALSIMLGCGALTAFSPKPVQPSSRPVQYLPGASFDPTITNGLTNLDRQLAYNQDYGIQYLPTNVLLSLKRPTSDSIPTVMDEMFFDHPERFGLLPNYVNPNSPLPIGITSSTDTEYVPMSGINCYACHTSIISNPNNQFFLVDNASSRFQIDVFLGDMLKSVIATLLNPIEFEAFFDRYSVRTSNIDSEPADTTTVKMASLVQRSITTSSTKELEATVNGSIPHQSGKATTLTSADYPTYQQLSTRTGMYVYMVRRFIYLFSLAKYGTNPTGSEVSSSGPGRANPWYSTKALLSDEYLHSKNPPQIAGGPINIPYVWDYDRQYWIFLLGNTNSMVERNIAQSIALLSSFNPTTFETTASIKKMDIMTSYAKKAHAPTWPENILGPIDRTLAATGKQIFVQECLHCHDPKADNQTTGSAFYNYVDVGTDPNYYYGQIEKLDGKDLFSDVLTPFMSKVKAAAIKNESITDEAPYEQGRLPVVWKGPRTNALIAKPLAGVWATAPFLHNGSVPTIRDLLNQAYVRPSTFHIGGFVYNSKDLGYYSDTSLPYGYDMVISCQSGCVGNSNSGHEFGTDLSIDDKNALIEFLKSYDSTTTF